MDPTGETRPKPRVAPLRLIARRALDSLELRSEKARATVAGATVLGTNVRARDVILSRLYFELTAHRWSDLATRSEHFAAFRAAVEEVEPPRRVLDLGTGAGGSAAIVAERFPNASVIGIDVSRRMVHLARSRHQAKNLEFKHARLEQLPFQDGAFDLVTASNAAPDPRELRRVLVRGGQVLIANTFVDAPPSDAWRAVWSDAGFLSEGGSTGNPGSWQIWRASDSVG